MIVIVNALAPATKLIPRTCTLSEGETLVVFETAKVAISFNPLGTVAGVQLAAVFHSPLVGFRFHVALQAKAGGTSKQKKNAVSREISIVRITAEIGRDFKPIQGSDVVPNPDAARSHLYGFSDTEKSRSIASL